MSLRFELMNLDQLRDHISRYDNNRYDLDYRKIAIDYAHHFNRLQTTKLTTAQFQTAVTALAGVLQVTKPAVPNGYALKNIAHSAAVALADSLELAEWDWNKRLEAMESTYKFYAIAASPPSSNNWLDMFKDTANYMRTLRGLPDIT